VLLKAGAGVDKKVREGHSALSGASALGHCEVVSKLLKFGASVNQADEDGGTALLAATQEGKNRVMEMLIAHGAAVDQGNSEGKTPLSMASQQGVASTVALLLKHGASVNLAKSNGFTHAMIAAQNGHVPVIKLLLEHKANLHAVNNQGLNALHCAAFYDHPEACLLLIAQGLDPAALDHDGDSALTGFGVWLDGNAPENEDVNFPRTRAELSPEAKTQRCALLTDAREAFLLQQRRDANWQRRFPFLDALVGSKLRATAAVAAQQKLALAAAGTSAKPVTVSRRTKAQNRDYLQRAVFSDEGFVRKIAAFL